MFLRRIAVGVTGHLEMFSELQDQLRKRSQLLFEGRVEEYARAFVTPAVFYSADGMLPVCSHAAMVDTAKVLRKSLIERGIVACHPTVSAADLPRKGRFRVWVDWQEIAADNSTQPVHSSINYMRQTPNGPRTEMVDWLGASCAPMKTELKQRRRVLA
jgi:hypothetical protein